jgi:hypothetical protein
LPLTFSQIADGGDLEPQMFGLTTKFNKMQKDSINHETPAIGNVLLADGASISEAQIKEIGFKLTDSYNHDHYHTNRYKQGCLEVEFTYENDKLLTCDLTISELNCMPISFQEIKAISKLIGHWLP